MCGLFGLVRLKSDDPAVRQRGTSVVFGLGLRSEERGRDAAGVALLSREPVSGALSAPTRKQVAAKVATVDGATVVKAATRFSQLNTDEHLAAISRADIVLGHTRFATQGAASSLVNASPMFAGALLGTHNGDVSPESVANAGELSKVVMGQTDSELLFHALNRVRGDRRSLVKVLRGLQGRAALAFVDRGRPDRLYLARTALSPLSFAYTSDGDLAYASNPDWFRQVERETRGAVSFRDITLVPEGHLLTFSTVTGQIVDRRRFTATCRDSDLPLINSAVYRNFTREDKAADRTLTRRRVVAGPLRSWPELTLAPAVSVAGVRPARATGDELWTEESLAGSTSLVDMDELERLCWLPSGEFDLDTFNEVSLAGAEDAADLMVSLRADRAAS
jgi:glucosamine--fructose-6-phosphate aminotransferase (isomerizing)